MRAGRRAGEIPAARSLFPVMEKVRSMARQFPVGWALRGEGTGLLERPRSGESVDCCAHFSNGMEDSPGMTAGRRMPCPSVL